MMGPPRPLPPLAPAVLSALLAGCQTSTGELAGLAEQPPLDYAVLVTGTVAPALPAAEDEPVRQRTFGTEGEPVATPELLAVLQDGSVFRRVALDPEHRERLELLHRPGNDPEVATFLQGVRDQGFDWLLVVEELRDGPVELQGINGRWPITLGTWFLFGLGFLIPDHGFESRATLRVSVRDLGTGRVVHDPLLSAGPVDLSLVERSNFLGLLTSILVPPFWVHDDDENVRDSVRAVTERRLLLYLARDLKSAATRQRLREESVARIDLERRGNETWLSVDARESLAVVRLRQEGGRVDLAAENALQSSLLASQRQEDGRFHYEAALPRPPRAGLLQVLVGTIQGSSASATFATGGPR